MRTRSDRRATLVSIAGPVSFFAFVVAGCAYIVCAKLAALSPFLVTFVPVGTMVLYAACVKFVGLLRLREDQAGDNLYYLGFLYTLTSLGVSLYQFRADGPAEEIVQNFGVAIGSTIAGVALRVMFAQMRRDPADVEHSARLEMAEAARRMRRELDMAVVELAHFRRATEQQVFEGFESVRDGMEQVTGRILASFEDMTKKASKPIETASKSSGTVLAELAETIGRSLDSAAARLASESERLALQTASIAESLEATSERLASMQMPDRVIEVRFEPIARSLATTMEGFAKQIQQKDEIDRGVIEAISRSGEQHRKQGVSLGNLAKAMEKRSETAAVQAERALALQERTIELLNTVVTGRSSGWKTGRDESQFDVELEHGELSTRSPAGEKWPASSSRKASMDIPPSPLVDPERDLDDEFRGTGAPAVVASR